VEYPEAEVQPGYSSTIGYSHRLLPRESCSSRIGNSNRLGIMRSTRNHLGRRLCRHRHRLHHLTALEVVIRLLMLKVESADKMKISSKLCEPQELDSNF
jgi:hypothetical protein